MDVAAERIQREGTEPVALIPVLDLRSLRRRSGEIEIGEKEEGRVARRQRAGWGKVDRVFGYDFSYRLHRHSTT